MAGQGYRRWIPGEVITADNIQQYLMDQSVQRFADDTARTTALTGYLAEGMLTYLDSTKSLEVFDGTDWVAVEPTDLDASVITSGTFNAARIPDLDASKITGTTLSVERFRGTSTGGVSLSSSTHALQTGLTDGANLAFDANEIQARNSGAAGSISINRLGGNVDIGDTTTGMGIEGSELWANGVYGNSLSTSFRSVYVSSTDTRNKLGYVPSSRELKKNIEPLRYTAEQVLAIEPVEFHYNTQADTETKSVGFIAEEMHDAGLTAFVSYDDNGKPSTIHYEFFAVALQQVLRDQDARLQSLEARLNQLEQK
jgi:hypothetical protein